MYRQWASFKLQAYIYKYHMAAGAATYFAIPEFMKQYQVQKEYLFPRQESRRLMQDKGFFV